MNQITLKQLRYFQALARHGHFGHAAAASAISQPALSMQIKELEDTLGAALFERTRRAVKLTPFGEAFDDRAQTILRAVEELGDLARAARSGLVGRLRLGVIPTIAPYLLPALIGQVSQAYPDLDIQVRETVTPRLVQELADGRVDAAIVALPVSEPSLTEVALFDEDFVMVRPQGTGDGQADLADMPGARLLLLEEGHCFRDQALAFCNATGTAPRDGMDGSSLSTLVQMVGAGLGVTLLPAMAVPVETRSAAVSVARFGDPAPSRTVGMVWRRSSPLGPEFHRLSELVKTASSQMWVQHKIRA